MDFIKETEQVIMTVWDSKARLYIERNFISYTYGVLIKETKNSDCHAKSKCKATWCGQLHSFLCERMYAFCVKECRLKADVVSRMMNVMTEFADVVDGVTQI